MMVAFLVVCDGLIGLQLFVIGEQKLYSPFFMERVQLFRTGFNCLKATKTLQGDSLLFTTSPQEFLVLNSLTLGG